MGSPGSFGRGGAASTNTSYYNRSGGGGAGFYGGGGGGYQNSGSYYYGTSGGGGGSGYVNKEIISNAFTTQEPLYINPDTNKNGYIKITVNKLYAAYYNDGNSWK